MNACGDG
jgi:hypothetical protein